MNERLSNEVDRRGFLAGIVPACALTCMGSTALSMVGPTQAEGCPAQETHKFDQPVTPVPSWRRQEVIKLSRFLEFAEYLSVRMGREELIGLVKDFQADRNRSQAAGATRRLGSNDFEAFKRFYDPSIPALNRIVTLEVVESTERVFEWRITECINTEPFLRANAADLGYAAVCWGDFAFAEAFNPAIRLTRDKTLMQGDSYCNHKYTWEG